MSEFKDKTYNDERSLFASKDSTIFNCVFEDGESPLKESRNIVVKSSTFKWKYPLWYCVNVTCDDMAFEETARSGIWYTKNIKITNSTIKAPKTFRYAENVDLYKVNMPNAAETFWNSKGIRLNEVNAKGDYFGFHSEDIEIDNLYLEGNYAFDSASNIVVRNSTLISKDSFWNTKNVLVVNCKIIGEYIGWNSKNVTFINCVIESHQGLCYMGNVKLVNCQLINSDLCFEYCTNIDAEITSVIDSIKNPYSGRIHAFDIKEIILDEQYIDKKKTTIILDNKHE